MPLDDRALKALDKLEILAAEELTRIPHKEGIFHDEGFTMLSNVPSWIRFVKANHENPFASSAVEGCLENLRRVTKRFKFHLNDSRQD